MKKLINTLSLLLLFTVMVGVTSCTQDEDVSAQDAGIVEEAVLKQIAQLGFSTENVIHHRDGYLVEGDIYLPAAHLNRTDLHQMSLRIAETEQYHTTNLVTGTPRTINVYMRLNERGRNKKLNLPSTYEAGLDEALARYNAENISLTFNKVSSENNADIIFENTRGSFLASAGFPTSSGDPHNLISVNSSAIGEGTSQTFINYLATILAHEMGHCIGFRHTDYMDRSYSCGGSPVNEGPSTVGAIHIPGTPTTPDAGSFMLSCIGSGGNRPFNANDVTALEYLY